MTEQPNIPNPDNPQDETASVVPDSASPDVAETTDTLTESTDVASADNGGEATFQADTSGNDAAPEPSPVAPTADANPAGTAPESPGDTVSEALAEIHVKVNEIHALVKEVEPTLRQFAKDMNNGGIGSMFGSMFGGRSSR